MTGEEKLNEFVQAIEDWVSCKGLIIPEKPNKKISRVLAFTSETLKILTAEECLCYAYDLHNYGEYLESVKAKENAILEWADSSIWYIISTVMQNYGTQYTKWQEKYYSAIKENPLFPTLGDFFLNKTPHRTYQVFLADILFQYSILMVSVSLI